MKDHCWCDQLINPTDDEETGFRCRCTAEVGYGEICDQCTNGYHVDKNWMRVKAVGGGDKAPREGHQADT